MQDDNTDYGLNLAIPFACSFFFSPDRSFPSAYQIQEFMREYRKNSSFATVIGFFDLCASYVFKITFIAIL